MATPIPNTFTSYSFQAEELLAASTLNLLQKCLIQTKIAAYAEQQIAAVFDPVNPHQFGLQVAALTGKIEALQDLLWTSQEAEEQSLQIAKSSKE